MRWAIIVLILLGVVAATSAAFLVASYSGSKNPPTPNVEILVTIKAFPAMTVVDAGMVIQKTVARKEAPANYFTNAVQVVGKMLIVPIAEGQVLTAECFGDRESGARLAAAIPAGMVAAAISLRDYSSLEGLLYPGCLVDVIFTLKPNNDQQPVSVTLLQGVQVFAIEQYSVVSPKSEADRLAPLQRGESRKITLLLTPRQAKELHLAMENGSVSLSLRNPLNSSAADGGSISLNELLGKEKTKAPAPALPLMPSNTASQPAQLPPGWEMVLIQGGVKEKRSFPMPGEK